MRKAIQLFSVGMVFSFLSTPCIRVLGAEPKAESFSRQIEPLLKTHCFKCHSHDSGKMKGGLALDSRSGWEKGGDSGPTLVPGKPEDSILLYRIESDEPSIRMPTLGRNQADQEAIELIRAWIASMPADSAEVGE